MTNNDIKIKEVEKFWDNIAGEYDRINRKIGRAHFQRFEESLKYLDLKTDDKVLNIWSRTGNGISYIKETENINLYNLEVSGKMIRIAKEKYPEEYFAKTDLTNLDYQKNAQFIIGRVLDFGNLEDWKTIKDFYGIEKIKEAARNHIFSNPKDANFWSVIFEIPLNKLRCERNSLLKTPKAFLKR